MLSNDKTTNTVAAAAAAMKRKYQWKQNNCEAKTVFIYLILNK